MTMAVPVRSSVVRVVEKMCDKVISVDQHFVTGLERFRPAAGGTILPHLFCAFQQQR
jgi:hypothetical protein